MALKCYSGEAWFFENREGLRVPGRYNEKQKPRLRDCGRHEDLCLTYYAKTDLKFGRTYDGIQVLVGSGYKKCVGSSSGFERSGEFAGDFSERCIESKEDLRVCFNICNMSR